MQGMMTSRLGPLSKFTDISLWFDAGPHFRPADLWSFVVPQQWLLKANRLKPSPFQSTSSEKNTGKAKLTASSVVAINGHAEAPRVEHEGLGL